VNESEPNNTIATADPIPFGPGEGDSWDIDIDATMSPSGDVDYFTFYAWKGDVLGIAALGSGPNPRLAITDASGVELVGNDNHGNAAGLYPPDSPLPGGASASDSVVSWISPALGSYYIKLDGSGTGPYQIQVRGGRASFEALPPNAHQIVFLDFDGATVDAPALFGNGNNPATLDAMDTFLANWGLTAADEDDVIDAILATVNENLDDLRLAGLNGDRPTDHIMGHFDVELRNSRDHADPFGQPNVARLIVGGTIAQFGIGTIGIAEFIDPGNHGREDTAVVLLDLLSAGAGNPNSINGIPRAAGTTIIDAIGIVTGNIVTHELGHLLGNWHTENGNALACLMDRGGLPVTVFAGVGPDGILGTADDLDVDFEQDTYESDEVFTGTEWTDLRTAFGLATGSFGIYVDLTNTGWEFGTELFPYDTVREGATNCPLDGTVIIRTGVYYESPLPLVLDRRVTYVAENGPVTIR